MENTVIIFTSDNGGDIPGPHRPEAPERLAQEYGLKINGDLRGDKHTIYEGGCNAPLIVSWPGVVKEGSVSDDMVNLLDIFVTEGMSEERLEKLKDFKPQLDNLDEDPGETTNLLQTNPDMAKKLSEKLNEIRNSENSR